MLFPTVTESNACCKMTRANRKAQQQVQLCALRKPRAHTWGNPKSPVWETWTTELMQLFPGLAFGWHGHAHCCSPQLVLMWYWGLQLQPPQGLHIQFQEIPSTESSTTYRAEKLGMIQGWLSINTTSACSKSYRLQVNHETFSLSWRSEYQN